MFDSNHFHMLLVVLPIVGAVVVVPLLVSVIFVVAIASMFLVRRQVVHNTPFKVRDWSQPRASFLIVPRSEEVSVVGRTVFIVSEQ